MIDIIKVAQQIKEDVLYNTIYFEVKEHLNNSNPSYEEIEQLLKNEESFLQEYRNINRYSELSSIHAKALTFKEEENSDVKEIKEIINQNVQTLKNLENYSVDSKGSAYEIWIGSVGIMIVFMLHNVIALFTELYSTHGAIVYTLFALILYATYYGYTKMKKNHEKNHSVYKALYHKTQTMIEQALQRGDIEYYEMYEHIN